MSVYFLLELFKKHKSDVAVFYNDSVITYNELLKKVETWHDFLNNNISHGDIVAVKGDFSPNTIALLLALINHKSILVPLARNAKKNDTEQFLNISQAQWLIELDENDNDQCRPLNHTPSHKLLAELKNDGYPGLILFTSGSSGTPKATVHNFDKLLDKFHKKRETKRILNFLLFDHWGGLNTMFHILAGAGTLISISDRSPDNVCKNIEKHRIEILPTSPTFLNLMLLSGAHKRYDLSSLSLITYGTEPMQANTLEALFEAFPDTKIQQTYGLIELGVMRSTSKSPDSLWVKLGGKGYEWRVNNNILEIKAYSAMLGYLNAPSPFTDDGWFVTGDFVEQDGDYLKILGRKSELINIGGEKVFPVEIENVIQKLPNVAEVTVFPRKHAITGNIICAKIRLIEPEDKQIFRKKLKRHCGEHLDNFKIPAKIEISNDSHLGHRLKKIRQVK